MTMLSLVPNRSRLKTGCAAGSTTAACWFLCLSPENHGNLPRLQPGETKSQPKSQAKKVWLLQTMGDAWLVVAFAPKIMGTMYSGTSGVTKL
jgi:hypothetical protein